VKDGAQGFGEMKFHVAADGPELRRVYALAADLRVPILVHFQEVDHFPNEGTWSTGSRRRSRRCSRPIPKTTFIGHADAFWANLSADYHNEAAYPPAHQARRRHRQAGSATTPISSATCPPTPATTRCHAMPRSPPIS
jgi:hypothetical protein